ncbi:hypothetical protein OUZ56_002885 [Daphnia magna]|uniref:Uncharacterized protein n=1 Tax=Daphnia magna TaxID=35525 RepID=A0ABR0A727_9CRUS|nr:hypothetical protein OUZ56_002885 [Daphnia magna]
MRSGRMEKADRTYTRRGAERVGRVPPTPRKQKKKERKGTKQHPAGDGPLKTHGHVFPPFCCKARLIGLIFGLLPAANTAHTHKKAVTM